MAGREYMSAATLAENLQMLEFSELAEQERWHQFMSIVRSAEHHADALLQTIDANGLFDRLYRNLPPATQTDLVSYKMQNTRQVHSLVATLKQLRDAAAVCQLKQQELQKNTSASLHHAGEAFEMHRPLDYGIVYPTPEEPRIDIFNPGLGVPERPPVAAPGGAPANPMDKVHTTNS
jgi:hypothetical protein